MSVPEQVTPPVPPAVAVETGQMIHTDKFTADLEAGVKKAEPEAKLSLLDHDQQKNPAELDNLLTVLRAKDTGHEEIGFKEEETENQPIISLPKESFSQFFQTRLSNIKNEITAILTRGTPPKTDLSKPFHDMKVAMAEAKGQKVSGEKDTHAPAPKQEPVPTTSEQAQAEETVTTESAESEPTPVVAEATPEPEQITAVTAAPAVAPAIEPELNAVPAPAEASNTVKPSNVIPFPGQEANAAQPQSQPEAPQQQQPEQLAA